MNRCEACESLLTHHSSDHIEPAFMCLNQRCSRYGICLTCELLEEWFGRMDEQEGPRGL